MSDLIVGIDLGTTNSELAILRNDRIEVLPIHGHPIMPSCVGLDPAGNLIVGQAARNQLIAAPENTVLSIKRKMGEDVKVPLGDRHYSPEEISSFILRELKLEAERQLGQPVAKAVITVPAFFNDRQRKATQIAGQLAGLDVVRILNEPTAAALAYGAGTHEGETMLVYDLGGGTFDVSVVVVEQGIVEVKASHGDTHLGGDDFDQLLVDHALTEFKRQHNVDLLNNPKALRRLKVVMERAKRTLSDEPFVRIREEYLDDQHHLDLELLRSDYEALILPLLQRTLDCCHQSLADARLGPKDLHKVMLVGGATRTPLVHDLLQDRLRLDPRFEIDPDLIVAMGAAVQAGIVAGQKHHSILVDITPHTWNTAALSNDSAYELICIPVIPRNTPLPASKSEMVSTVVHSQKEARVEVYQGESQRPSDNLFIGDFLISGLGDVPAGNPVVIHFDLDVNGMLKVTATEKNTGLAKSVTIDTRGHHAVDLDQARRNIAALVGSTNADPNDQTPPDTDTPPSSASDPTQASQPPGAPPQPVPSDSQTLLNTAKDLRKRAETLLEKGTNEDDAAEIRNLVHQSATAIRNADWTALGTHNDALSDLLFYLED